MVRKSKNHDKSTTSSTLHSPLAYLKRPYFKRSRVCPLAQYSERDIDYKNVQLISKFISEGKRILARRITSVSAQKQRLLSTAIKRARYLALVPYCN